MLLPILPVPLEIMLGANIDTPLLEVLLCTGPLTSSSRSSLRSCRSSSSPLLLRSVPPVVAVSSATEVASSAVGVVGDRLRLFRAMPLSAAPRPPTVPSFSAPGWLLLLLLSLCSTSPCDRPCCNSCCRRLRFVSRSNGRTSPSREDHRVILSCAQPPSFVRIFTEQARAENVN